MENRKAVFSDELLRVLADIDKHTDELKKLWVKLAEIESPSYYKTGVDHVAEAIIEFSKSYGIAGEIISFEKAGNSVWLRDDEGIAQGKREIVLMAHMDTVHAVGSFPSPIVREKDGFLYGPGVYDCKGGIAVALLCTIALRKNEDCRYAISLFFTGDEEVGHRNSDEGCAIEKAVQKAYVVYNCECASMDGKVCVGRKGAHNFQLLIKGVGAHSGNDPEKGRSAICEAAHKIIALEAITDIYGTGTIVNCGLIEGGSVVNAIPEQCKIDVNVRYKSMKEIEYTMQQVYNIAAKSWIEGTVTEVIERNKPHAPMVPNAKNQWMYEQYKKSSEELGYETNQPLFAGGGSDAIIPYLLGIPVLCQVGVRGESHHTLRERAWIQSLNERSKMLAKTILELT